MNAERGHLTQLLYGAAHGDAGAESRLLDAIYHELRAMASGQVGREHRPGSLGGTALVHEVYVRLMGDRGQAWENRAHFFGAAGEAMRRILVEHARARLRVKRGGGWRRVDIDQAETTSAGDDADPADVLALDAALERLQGFDPALAEVVKLRCFIGLTVAETATALEMPARSVDRAWAAARAWLKAELAGGGSETERGGE
jgi:RNA polymerase sigma factor (TIGR02999 family)